MQSAKDVAGSVRDMAGDAYVAARKSTTDAAGKIHDAILSNLWASVGIAAGAGLLVGMILARVRS